MAQTKAYGYLRVSGRGQIDGDGFPRQVLAIQEYANAHGIEVVEMFREEGVCGATEWEGRPAWMEMLVRIVGNGVRTILIEKLDRLARDVMVQEHIIQDLRRRKIEIISVMEPDLCKDDPSRNFNRQILGAVAGYDRAIIVLRLRGSRQRKRIATGRCEGAKPYGHYKGEAEVRDGILEDAKAGGSAASIARELNARGVKARAGGLWHPWTVRRVVGRGK